MSAAFTLRGVLDVLVVSVTVGIGAGAGVGVGAGVGTGVGAGVGEGVGFEEGVVTMMDDDFDDVFPAASYAATRNVYLLPPEMPTVLRKFVDSDVPIWLVEQLVPLQR